MTPLRKVLHLLWVQVGRSDPFQPKSCPVQHPPLRIQIQTTNPNHQDFGWPDMLNQKGAKTKTHKGCAVWNLRQPKRKPRKKKTKKRSRKQRKKRKEKKTKTSMECPPPPRLRAASPPARPPPGGGCTPWARRGPWRGGCRPAKRRPG